MFKVNVRGYKRSPQSAEDGVKNNFITDDCTGLTQQAFVR